MNQVHAAALAPVDAVFIRRKVPDLRGYLHLVIRRVKTFDHPNAAFTLKETFAEGREAVSDWGNDAHARNRYTLQCFHLNLGCSAYIYSPPSTWSTCPVM